MKTTRIFYEDVYRTACEATVEEISLRDGAVWVRLNQTVFYPEGGGQPCDTGVLEWREHFGGTCQTAVHRARISDVQEEGEYIWHRLELDRQWPAPKSGEQPADSPLRRPEDGVSADSPLRRPEDEALAVSPLRRPEDGVSAVSPVASLGLTVGCAVRGRINRERRLDLMRQHSGEHIVSGLIHARYGYENVGFHLTMDTMTVDISGELSWEELMEIEAAANRLIRENRPVEITYPSPEELKSIPYRSKKELTGDVRIVTIPGGDICACCGTHVSHTGEIGLVKLTAMQKWKQGVRVWMCCGERAESYCRMLQSQNRQISVALSAKPEATAEAVERVLNELTQLKAELTGWKYRFYESLAAGVCGQENAVLFEEALSMDDLRHFADRLMRTCPGYCIVFSGSDAEGYRYALGRRDGDVRQLVAKMNGALNGRGGGKPRLAQGTVRAARGQIEAFIRSEGIA